ncbi:hypothetical protein BFG57_15320 [Bacillus solimangrovi]|uniref:Putative amidase domain-containing protein n=1 Tax=Bacillus solimangrovi TaxID=1305675 RepID=A0A1E5LEM6_9BACI|nr:hypothetical protein BFG57_15320 [Bacillus solimangrovi]
MNSRLDNEVIDEEQVVFDRKKQMFKKRGAEIVKTNVEAFPSRERSVFNKKEIEYRLKIEFLVKQGGFFYIEEQNEQRCATFQKGALIEDRRVSVKAEQIDELSLFEGNKERVAYYYDRRKAVQYAEKWWDGRNPAYRDFDVDCTNFISQCLRAGGAPMTGHPNRAKGWWYSGNNWSYSWAVAHSLRWYLSGAKQGLQAKEKHSAQELIPGDVICYDFQGTGKWDHNTIVVAKDDQNEPLVNAHTNDSRMRYWKYEDSAAWTPDIKYKFFHILSQD